MRSLVDDVVRQRLNRRKSGEYCHQWKIISECKAKNERLVRRTRADKLKEKDIHSASCVGGGDGRATVPKKRVTAGFIDAVRSGMFRTGRLDDIREWTGTFRNTTD